MVGREGAKRAGLGHGHVGFFDAGAEERQTAHRFRHLVDRVVAIGEQLHAAFHHRQFDRRLGPCGAFFSCLRFELAHVFQFPKHDAIRGAFMIAL